ncbi:MAG: fructosamine kinase family protein [Melioribacteraceae bacterium]|nr:fructosamine kinase family protein [Melioribacteraceae bacterium]
MKNLEEILNEKVTSNSFVGGGSIADSQKIRTSSGKEYFVKSYSQSKSNILKNEVNGLIEIQKSKSIKTPQIIYYDDNILILEFIKSGRKNKNFSELFGIQLTEMHRLKSDKFGFYENNYIGSNHQINLPLYSNWTDFYWENRLLYQFKLAEKHGYVNSDFRKLFNQFESVYRNIIEGTEEEPSLIHGDLWGGNYLVDESGNPVLIDPAVYYGHREAELGMTILFGGFDSDFYSSYNEAYPLFDGWKERLDIYKLYHVMNHLNLFGTGYLNQTLSIIKSYL